MSARRFTGWGMAVAIAFALLSADSWAMPMFARKYQTSCMTCHEAFPRKNAVGEAFRLNGFRFADEPTYRKEEPVEIGDEAYERLWPKAIWPSDLPRNLPLSIATRLLTEVDMDGSRNQDLTFLLPEEMEAVWAGTFGKDISFYGDFIFLQKDFAGTQTDSWATVKAWLQFQNLLGDDNYLNVRLGTVGTQSMGLATALDSNMYTTHFYQYSSWTMPLVDLKKNKLSEFNGNKFSIQPQMGVELNGCGKRWSYAAAVVDGNVRDSVNEVPDRDFVFYGTGNGANSKDVYGQFNVKIGGLPFSGIDEKKTDPLAANPQFWRDDSLLLSAWGYLGHAEISATTLSGKEWKTGDQFWRAGIGALQKYKDIQFGVGYIYGRDENPYGYLSSEPVISQAYHAEILYFAYPWLLPYVRFEGITLDISKDLALETPKNVTYPEDRDVERFVTGVKSMVRANVGLTVEANLYTKGEDYNQGLDNTLYLLVTAAF